MAYVSTTAPRRDQKACAKNNDIRQVLQHLRRWWQQRKRPGIARLSDHQARDIGLTPADLARHRHRWPSQSTTHPQL